MSAKQGHDGPNHRPFPSKVSIMSHNRFYVSKVVANPSELIMYQTLIKGPMTLTEAEAFAREESKKRTDLNVGYSVLELKDA